MSSNGSFCSRRTFLRLLVILSCLLISWNQVSSFHSVGWSAVFNDYQKYAAASISSWENQQVEPSNSSSSSANTLTSHDDDASSPVETHLLSGPRNVTTTLSGRDEKKDAPNTNVSAMTSEAASVASVSVSVSNRSNSGSSGSSIDLTPAQKCRIELTETYFNPMIDKFLEMGQANPPMINWMWDLVESEQQFLLDLKMDSIQPWKKQMLYGANFWWKDQFENIFPAERNLKGAKHFFHLRVPLNTTGERSIPQFFWFDNYTLPVNQTIVPWVYDLRPITKCDELELAEEERPPPSTKIGMCLSFAGNHELLPQFFAYHKLIGVQHFWIYLNEAVFNVADLPEADYISYVPFNLTMVGRRRIAGVGYPRPPFYFFQLEAQQQCLYRAKRYELDWIMINDVDEYLWVNELEQSSSSDDKFPPRLVSANSNASSPSILATFLKPFEQDPNLGSLLVQGWAFGAREEKNVSMLVDMTMRTASPCGGKDKHIYRVPTALDVGGHWLFDGGKTHRMSFERVRWNHYRKVKWERRNGPRPPDYVVYMWHLAKNQTLVQDMALKDKYQSAMQEWIHDHPSPLIKST